MKKKSRKGFTMLKHFEALKNLYGEYLALNKQIKRAIESKAYEELAGMAERKGKILEGILRQESIVELDEAQKQECIALRNEIIKLEETNLAEMTAAKDATYGELTAANKTANLQKAYVFEPETGEIFDVSE